MLNGFQPIFKKNGKLRVCVDVRNQQSYTNEWITNADSRYVADAASGHKVISFMDDNAGYN
jgi:hypothetical protein